MVIYNLMQLGLKLLYSKKKIMYEVSEITFNMPLH